MNTRLTLLFTLALMGCAPDPEQPEPLSEEEFLVAVSEATCERAQECHPIKFDNHWDSMDACVDEALELATCWSECFSLFEEEDTHLGVEYAEGDRCSYLPGNMLWHGLTFAYENYDQYCGTYCTCERCLFGWGVDCPYWPYC